MLVIFRGGGQRPSTRKAMMMSVRSTLQVNERRHRSFLARQFTVEPTKAQNNFDVAFGVFLPVVCFMFDPIVFKSATFPGVPPVWPSISFLRTA
jgi:hypothetical protein